MNGTPSIARSIGRLYVASILGIALSVVCVAAVSAAYVVVKRDDVGAHALCQTLGAELHEHPEASLHEQGEVVRHELDEQRWFLRELEVWRDDVRIGGSKATSRLGTWARSDGCTLAELEGTWRRVCTFDIGMSTRVVVASAMGPLLAAEVPLIAAIAGIAALAVLGFSLLSQRLVRRSLEPLARFEREMADLPASVGHRMPAGWGAREINHLAQTFNSLLERIDEMVEREQAFAANAAHELRTPLTRLRGQLGLLLDRPQVDAETKQRLERAAKTCVELVDSTEALLALSRKNASLDEAVDLMDIALSVKGNLSDADSNRVELQGASEAVVRGDAALLRLAAQNLVDNALKYSDGAIELCIRGEACQCILQVTDSGPGISGSELAVARQPFTRGAQRSSQVRGSGLGLALVDHVALLHGGELALENRVDRGGLVASLRLPPWSPRALPLVNSSQLGPSIEK